MSESPAGQMPGPGSHWYEWPSSGVEQGDVLLSFPLLVPVAGAEAEYTFGKRDAQVVVLTQTCDIAKPAQKHLLVGVVHDYDSMVAAGAQHLKSTDYKQALARGTAIADFLLPPTSDGRMGWSVVSFREVFTVPKLTLMQVGAGGNVIRIVSPYKEYLSQAFGRFVMRVGLPSTLSEFEKRKP